MYDSTIHCAALGLAPSCARTIGSAALTTEPSMKVMLDARIVVPSTTRPLALAAGPKVLKASSVAGQLKRAPGYPLWSSRSGPQYRARVIHDCERRRKSNQCDEWR